MSSNEPVRVTDADREAWIKMDDLDGMGARACREGRYDDCVGIQILARQRHLGWAEGHRAASEELARHRTLSQADGRREAGASSQDVLRWISDASEPIGMMPRGHDEVRDRARLAIRSLGRLAHDAALTEVHREKSDG